MTPTLPLALTVLLLAGCSRDATSYPSLAPRPVEKLGFAEPEVPVAVATPDAALDAKIADLRGRLTETVAGFDRVAAAANRAAGRPRATTMGSDTWLDAQSALAECDDWRARTTALVGEVEALAIARAGDLAPEYPALVTLGDAARAAAARQTTEVNRLQGLTPGA